MSTTLNDKIETWGLDASGEGVELDQQEWFGILMGFIPCGEVYSLHIALPYGVEVIYTDHESRGWVVETKIGGISPLPDVIDDLI
jgi:hypothetical protein